MTGQVFRGWGSGMGWILCLAESGVEGLSGSVDVLEIDRPGDLGALKDLGPKHAEQRVASRRL
jgi:hypothetical protein